MIHVKAVEICSANNNRQKTKSGDEDRKLKGNCIRLLLTVRKSYAHVQILAIVKLVSCRPITKYGSFRIHIRDKTRFNWDTFLKREIRRRTHCEVLCYFSFLGERHPTTKR